MASNLLSLAVLCVIFAIFVESSRGTTRFKTKEQLANELSANFLGRARSRGMRFRRQAFEYHTPAPSKYNVIYVLDSSSSISNVDFKIALKAIEHLTLKARPDTRYAAVLFSSYAQVVSPFTSPQGILRKLKTVHRLRGGTNFYDALRTCSELFNNQSSGLNPKALNRVLIVTDGLSNIKRTKTLSQALQLKLNDTEIFVVAVGHYQYGLTEISFLASSLEAHVFRVKTMKGLFDVTKWIPYADVIDNLKWN